MTPWVLLTASYLAGAIPSSYLVGRARGIDLRLHGSGNLGATNTYRVLGWRLAAPVFVFDILKGFVPVWFFPRLDGTTSMEWAVGYGIAAIIGHVYSVFVRFRGGKGVATSAGVFLALAPLALLAGLAVWGALVLTTGIVSLASVAGALVVPLAVLVLYGTGIVFWSAAGLAAFIVFAHRANLRRLVRGEEPAFRRSRASSGGTP